MEELPSQSDQMQSELMQLLKGIVIMTMFSWIGYYIFLEELPSLLWPSVGVLYFLLALVVIRKLERAYAFYWLIYVLALICALLLFDGSLHLIFAGRVFANVSLVWLILIGVGLTLFGFWSQVQMKRFQLNISLKHNIKSGRLDLKRGYWNFDKPLHFDLPGEENKKIRVLKRLPQLSPLVTAFGFAVARAIDGGWQTVAFGICLYALGCVVAWGSAKYLALAFQLRYWEREYNVVIKI